MTKPIRLTAQVVNGPAPCHASGLPDRSAQYKQLNYWTGLASLLERGGFDAMLIVDPAGPEGSSLPRHDSMMLVSAMAHVTRRLGFAVAASTEEEIPAVFARRLSSLDHFSTGRIGWCIGRGEDDGQTEEFLDVAYKLWEQSWEDGAVVRDRHSGIFADPAKVHRVEHAGRFFQLDTIHISEPSLQRTPLLIQAVATDHDLSFAARHAEVVILQNSDPAALGPCVRDLRARMTAQGRMAEHVIILAEVFVILGKSRNEAKSKQAEYQSLTAESNAVIAGTPTEVADRLQTWIMEAGVDGFHLPSLVMPETFEDVVDHLVPELQRRGVYGYKDNIGPLRAKLFNGTARLPVQHPGARFRHPTSK